MIHSLRARLTLQYAAVLLACLLAFAIWMWFAVARHIASTTDERLAQRAQGLGYTIDEASAESVEALREELREFAQSTQEGDMVSVRGRGELSLLLSPHLPEDALRNFPDGVIEDLKVGRVRYRGIHSRTTIKGQRYDLTLATSAAEGDRFMANFRLWLSGAVPILALTAGLAGFWMSRRALAPVDALTSAARRISLENLADRLDVSKTGDELERLGNTWNEMLARLDGSVRRIQQFTADASHELRTPISVIHTTAELALRRDRDSSEYREALESVRLEAEWMGQIAEDLLLLARSDAGTMALRSERVEIDQLARHAADQAAPIAQVRGVALRTELSADQRSVTGDERALRRLFSILLDNAVQHTPPEGTVAIQTTTSENSVTIAVSNSGEGIPSRDLPHIFDRFYRGDPVRSRQNGAGLGLAIARSIAQAHGVEIAVDTEAGKGAVFSVRFVG